MRIRRSIWANAALALLAPALFLLLLESLLAAAGIRPLALTEDPLVGFASLQPLFVEDPAAPGKAAMKTNPAKLTHFNPQGFPRKKPEGAYRIFTVGGSTTYGHPWRDPVSYSGWLRELLPAADPARKWEVINAGGISYASYREAKLVEEITRYRPDLIIVYSGHNEFLEERTYRKAAEIPAILREASALLDRTRTYTVMRKAMRKLASDPAQPKPPSAGAGPEGKARSGDAGAAEGGARPQLAAEVDDVLARTIGPETYTRDDSLRGQILGHFRLSLERMAALAHSAGAQVLFLTTPGNERDCSPFKSEPTPGLSEADRAAGAEAVRRADSLQAAGLPAEALSALEPALRRNPRDAGLLYRAGKAALAAGRHAEAKRLLDKALEEDVCPLRATSAMRKIVLETARKTGSEALDVTALLEAKTKARFGHDILGEPEFVDHVHLSIDEYRGLALAIVDKLINMGVVHPQAGWGEAAMRPVVEKVMAGMGSRELGEGLHNIAKVLNWAGKHDDAARIAAQGLAVDSVGLEAIWSSLFVGAALERQGRSADAVAHYRRAARLDPGNDMPRRYLYEALQRAGFTAEEAYRQTAEAAPLPGSSTQVPAGPTGPTPAMTNGPSSAMSSGTGPAIHTGPAPGIQTGSAPNGSSGQAGIAAASSPEAKASVMLQEGKVGEAMAFLQGIRAGTSDRAGLVLLLGEAQRRSGDAASALRSYRRVLQLDPEEARAHLGLARLAEAKGDIPETISEYALALRLAPDLDEARAALSRALQGMTAVPPGP